MNNNEILNLAASITAEMLEITTPEIRYLRNFEKATFGLVNEDIPNVVFLDLEEISRQVRGDENMVIYLSLLNLIHEMRHLWQQKNGWNYEFHLDYVDRKSEEDADRYAKHYINNILTKVYEVSKTA